MFDDFAPEPGGIGSGTVRVSDILARGVPIRWDEAVALLQEILETVLSAGGANAPMPAFENIIIDREGAVTIRGSRRGERGPVAAGRALHALLATADVPLPLRLFVTQANVPETHTSLQSFAEGLAYFGKPGHGELIRAIYDRYRTSAPASTSAPAAAPPPLSKAARTDEGPEPRRKTPRWLMPAAVGIAIVSVAAVIWFGTFGGGSSHAAAALTEIKAAITTAAPTIRKALARQTGRTVPAETPAHVQGLAAPTAPGRTQAPSERRAVGGLVGRNASLPRSFESVSVPSSPSPAPRAVSAESAALAVPVTREYVVAPLEGAATTIYSSDDMDVQPPLMMYPSLPPPVFVARNAEAVVVNRMELVIAADGSVERVRLVNGPTRMPDMMLLSGAKLWKFSPALKDGVPVRYRTSVTWSGFP